MKQSVFYSNRYEKNYVFDAKIMGKISKKLLNSRNVKNPHREIITTTYFEPVQSSVNNKSYVVRFRQRARLKNQDSFRPKKTYTVKGGGMFEIKIRDRKRNLTKKQGTFLSPAKEKNLYALTNSTNPEKFIKKANKDFLETVNKNNRIKLKPVSPKLLKRVFKPLIPQITRINIRDTFIIKDEVKITLESLPAFYPIPINIIKSQMRGQVSKNH